MNIPKCPICGKDCKRAQPCSTPKCFGKTCGNRECIKKIQQQTNLEKYGHISNLHAVGEDGKTIVSSIIENKYGVNNVSQIDEVKHKKRLTCRKNFGVDWPMQSKEVMSKSIKTCLQKYGNERYAMTDNFAEQFKLHLSTVRPDGLTNMEHRIKKAVETSKQMHDGLHLFQTEEFKKIHKLTMLERYGVENYFSSTEFDLRMKNMGFRRADDEIDLIRQYYAKVLKYTNRSYKQFKHILESEYKRSRNYHLDHIVSIIDGYNTKIDPEIMGSIFNLQIIDAKTNIIKNRQSWMAPEQLIEIFNQNRIYPLDS